MNCGGESSIPEWSARRRTCGVRPGVRYPAQKWLAARRPCGRAKSGLALFSNLTDDELTDDVIVEAVISATEVIPDRAAWQALEWKENAAESRAHLLEQAGNQLRYELFINSDADSDEAVAGSKQL